KRKNSILTRNYYESRLDAFIGWDEILSYMHRNYPELSGDVNACFVYSCVDHAYHILNEVKDKKYRRKYLNYIQAYIRKYYRQIRKDTVLTLKYKLITALLNYNVYLLIVFNNIKNSPRLIFPRSRIQ